jgi:hypothetical protein
MEKKLWMTQLNGWFNASENKECWKCEWNKEMYNEICAILSFENYTNPKVWPIILLFEDKIWSQKLWLIFS